MEIDRIESKGKNKGKGKGKSKDSSAQKGKSKGKQKGKDGKGKGKTYDQKGAKGNSYDKPKGKGKNEPKSCYVLLGIAGKLHRSEMLLQNRCQVQQLCKVLQVRRLEVSQAHRSTSLELSNCQ